MSLFGNVHGQFDLLTLSSSDEPDNNGCYDRKRKKSGCVLIPFNGPNQTTNESGTWICAPNRAIDNLNTEARFRRQKREIHIRKYIFEFFCCEIGLCLDAVSISIGDVKSSFQCFSNRFLFNLVPASQDRQKRSFWTYHAPSRAVSTGRALPAFLEFLVAAAKWRWKAEPVEKNEAGNTSQEEDDTMDQEDWKAESSDVTIMHINLTNLFVLRWIKAPCDVVLDNCHQLLVRH